MILPQGCLHYLSKGLAAGESGIGRITGHKHQVVSARLFLIR